jgi:hypothetical protein
MQRLFLDANVLFSAAYRHAAGIRVLWSVENVVLCCSEYAGAEARRNLETVEQRARLDELLASVEMIEAGSVAHADRGGVELPEKDWPIVAGALAAGATHLITGDFRHFGPYFSRRILGVLVLPPGEYMRSVAR